MPYSLIQTKICKSQYPKNAPSAPKIEHYK